MFSTKKVLLVESMSYEPSYVVFSLAVWPGHSALMLVVDGPVKSRLPLYFSKAVSTVQEPIPKPTQP